MTQTFKIIGQNLEQMETLTALANADKFMILDASEPVLSKKYKTITTQTLLTIFGGGGGGGEGGDTVIHEDCVVIDSVTDTVALGASPLGDPIYVFWENAPQFKSTNYNIVGSNIVFEFDLQPGETVCYKFAESLGIAAGLQDLQSVSNEGATTSFELDMPSLRLNQTFGAIKNENGDNILIADDPHGIGLIYDGTVKLLTTAAGVSLSQALEVAGAVKFTAHAADPEETQLLEIDEDGNINTIDFPTLDDVSDANPVTSNVLTIGGLNMNGWFKFENVAYEFLNFNNDPFFGQTANGGFKMYHDGIEMINSDDLGLILLNSAFLKFEGSGGRIMTFDYAAGRFDMVDEQGRGIILQNDGDIEFLTRPDGSGTLTKYLEVGKSGSIILNAGEDGTLTHVLFETSTGIVKKRAIGSWISVPFVGGVPGDGEYMKDPFGWVHFRGNFTYNGEIPFANMPVGFRPEAPGDSVFAVYEQPTGDNSSFVSIGNGGSMVAVNVSPGSEVWLDGISYYAG